MGLYDREYVREEEGSIWSGGGPRSMVVNLVLVNVALYIANFFTSRDTLTNFLTLRPDLFSDSWAVWELLTYGFAHDQRNIFHLLFNMLMLWFFGRDVEGIYGRSEFLRFYLVAVVVCGLAWVGAQHVSLITRGGYSSIGLLGASGAVSAVLALFICHFPRRTLLLWGIAPIPAWVFCAIFIAQGVLGLLGSDNGSHVSHGVHLVGAALGGLYYWSGMRLGQLVPSNFSLARLKPRPKLRIHRPDARRQDLNAEVDRILAKISESGQDSLTAKERQVLEDASRKYQRDRQS